MQSYAVIGHPIGHSMSPFIHNSLFALSGISVNYLKLDIDPDRLAQDYNDTLSELNGFNITIPHKQAIMPMLSEIDDSARLYGAVNCVSIKDKAVGYNTDAYGFCKSIAMRGLSLEGKVLLLGSGGAARTVAYETVLANGELTIAARSESGLRLADEIEHKLSKKVRLITFDEVKGGYDLVVNATPVGIYPKTDVSPLRYEQLEGCTGLFDAIYNPRKTMLMQYAEDRGAVVAEGMAMLVWQAARAHEIWYGAHFKDSDIERLIDLANLEMVRLFGDNGNE